MDGIFVVSLAVWLLSVMGIFPLAMENPTPVYDQEFLAKGSIPDDGCDSNSVKFDSDGQCYPLRGREPCSDPRQWVTVDPKTFKVNYTQIKMSYVIPVKKYKYKQCRFIFYNIRDGALRVFAEETESSSLARDFVTTFTINPRRRTQTLLFALRRSCVRLSHRIVSIPEPSGRLRSTFHARYFLNNRLDVATWCYIHYNRTLSQRPSINYDERVAVRRYQRSFVVVLLVGRRKTIDRQRLQ